jgi:hypothetical protein
VIKVSSTTPTVEGTGATFSEVGEPWMSPQAVAVAAVLAAEEEEAEAAAAEAAAAAVAAEEAEDTVLEAAFAAFQTSGEVAWAARTAAGTGIDPNLTPSAQTHSFRPRSIDEIEADLHTATTGWGLHSSTLQLNLSRLLSLIPPTDPSHPTKRAQVEPRSAQV